MTMFSPKINESLTDNFGSRCKQLCIFNYQSHETKIVLFCVHAKWILAV
jgi:hypothetical protein